MRQAVPLQPMKGRGGVDLHLQPGERGPHATAYGFPKEAVTSWEARAGAGSWQDLCPTTLEQSVPEGLQLVEGTHAGAVHEELQPMGRTYVGEVLGGLSPVGGIHGGAGDE